MNWNRCRGQHLSPAKREAQHGGCAYPLAMDNFSKHKHWRAFSAIVAPKAAPNGDLRFLVRYFTNWFNSNIGNNTASTIASTTTPINKIIAGSIIAASAAMRISISRCC